MREAIIEFRNVLQVDPEDAKAHYQLGLAYLKGGRPREAFSEFSKSVEKVAPQNSHYYRMLGHLLEVNKDVEQAEISFRKAIEIDSNDPQCYSALENFYVRQKRAEKAIEEYGRAIQKTPDSVSGHMGLGILYELQKKYDKAIASYRAALKNNPNFAPAANNLAYLYAKRGENIGEALTLAMNAKAQLPEDPNVSDTLGWVYYKNGIFSRAIVYLREANEKVSDYPIMHYHLGMAYYRNGNREESKKEPKRALDLDPGFSGAEEAKATLQTLK